MVKTKGHLETKSKRMGGLCVMRIIQTPIPMAELLVNSPPLTPRKPRMIEGSHQHYNQIQMYVFHADGSPYQYY